MTFPPALLGNSEHEGTQEVHDGNIGTILMWLSVGSVEGAFMKTLVYYKIELPR
jgi:hypothetical protein